MLETSNRRRHLVDPLRKPVKGTFVRKPLRNTYNTLPDPHDKPHFDTLQLLTHENLKNPIPSAPLPYKTL